WAGLERQRTGLRVGNGLWARLGLNQRPLACEASALPLSYAPGESKPISGSPARRDENGGACPRRAAVLAEPLLRLGRRGAEFGTHKGSGQPDVRSRSRRGSRLLAALDHQVRDLVGADREGDDRMDEVARIPDHER